jgi:hypothetical protein
MDLGLTMARGPTMAGNNSDVLQISILQSALNARLLAFLAEAW